MKSPATAIRRPRSAVTIRVSFRLSVFIGKGSRTRIQISRMRNNSSNNHQALSHSCKENLFAATLAELTLFRSPRSRRREKCLGQAISPRFPYFQRNGVGETFFGGLRRVLRGIRPSHAVLFHGLQKRSETCDLSDRLPAARRHSLERGHPSDIDHNQSHQHHCVR